MGGKCLLLLWFHPCCHLTGKMQETLIISAFFVPKCCILSPLMVSVSFGHFTHFVSHPGLAGFFLHKETFGRKIPGLNDE